MVVRPFCKTNVFQCNIKLLEVTANISLTRIPGNRKSLNSSVFAILSHESSELEHLPRISSSSKQGSKNLFLVWEVISKMSKKKKRRERKICRRFISIRAIKRSTNIAVANFLTNLSIINFTVSAYRCEILARWLLFCTLLVVMLKTKELVRVAYPIY